MDLKRRRDNVAETNGSNGEASEEEKGKKRREDGVPLDLNPAAAAAVQQLEQPQQVQQMQLQPVMPHLLLPLPFYQQQQELGILQQLQPQMYQRLLHQGVLQQLAGAADAASPLHILADAACRAAGAASPASAASPTGAASPAAAAGAASPAHSVNSGQSMPVLQAASPSSSPPPAQLQLQQLQDRNAASLACAPYASFSTDREGAQMACRRDERSEQLMVYDMEWKQRQMNWEREGRVEQMKQAEQLRYQESLIVSLQQEMEQLRAQNKMMHNFLMLNPYYGFGQNLAQQPVEVTLDAQTEAIINCEDPLEEQRLMNEYMKDFARLTFDHLSETQCEETTKHMESFFKPDSCIYKL